MRIAKTCVVVGLLLTFGVLAAGQAGAQPVNTPGKEYTDLPDKDNLGNADPEQVLLWNGLGAVSNGLDFGGDGELDAIANVGDAYYFQVTNNLVPLVFSVQGDNNIYCEGIGGGSGIWATPAQIDSNGVTDVDALEVWGPEGASDTTHYSLAGDPTGVAVWTAGGAVLYTDNQIAIAIGRPDLADQIDLDGLMMDGSSIMFSITPVGPFDGGEIWVWGGAAAPAVFLNHGGHLWHTAFAVAGTFNLGSENVNALEAVLTCDGAGEVPEPATLLLLGAPMAALIWRRRRR